MSERIRICRISPSGIAHEEDIVGDRLVSALTGTTVVVRVHAADGRVVRVVGRTGVSAMDWWPSEGGEVDVMGGD